MISVYLHTISN